MYVGRKATVDILSVVTEKDTLAQCDISKFIVNE